MKKFFAYWFLQFSIWLDPPAPFVETPVDPLFPEVKELVWLWQRNVQVSGEYKRHQAYATLRKLHPEVSHRHLGLLIEQAVQTLP